MTHTFPAALARRRTLPRASRAPNSKTPLTSTFSEKVQITVATELANSDVSVYTLMTLLGHESMVTSQCYVTAAGTETRSAAAQNKLYELLAEER
jgi:integrase/recombinase XerC